MSFALISLLNEETFMLSKSMLSASGEDSLTPELLLLNAELVEPGGVLHLPALDDAFCGEVRCARPIGLMSCLLSSVATSPAKVVRISVTCCAGTGVGGFGMGREWLGELEVCVARHVHRTHRHWLYWMASSRRFG